MKLEKDELDRSETKLASTENYICPFFRKFSQFVVGWSKVFLSFEQKFFATTATPSTSSNTAAATTTTTTTTTKGWKRINLHLFLFCH